MSLDLTHFFKSDGFLFTLEDIWSKAAGGLQHCLIRITFQFIVNNECTLLDTDLWWVGKRTNRTELCPLRQKNDKKWKRKSPQALAGILYLDLCHAACFYIFGCYFFFSWKRLLCWTYSSSKRLDCQLQQSQIHSVFEKQLVKEHHSHGAGPWC